MADSTLRVNFVGDVALFKKFERISIDPLSLVELPEADYNVANFEFPVCKNPVKNFFDVSDEYLVSYSFAQSLDLNKFDLYGLANNHIFDYGEDGVRDTCDLIINGGSSHFGVSEGLEDIHYWEKNGIRVAFIAAVKHGRWIQEEGGAGPNVIDYGRLHASISKASLNSDHVVVFLHWGTELVDAPAPEDVALAKSLVDVGASCVIGHHPHVPQGVVKYKHGLIAFSLGSFIYLSEEEKGNADQLPARDISICLNVEFSKSDIASFAPYKYSRARGEMIPECQGDFREDRYFRHLNKVIGDRRYYSGRVRKVLLKREILSFLIRLRKNPAGTLLHYWRYVKIGHIKKMIGFS